MIREQQTIIKSLDAEKFSDIDQELAWETFDPIAYRIVFENCLAGREDLTDPRTTDLIWEDVLAEWPEIYYMELYVKAGIAYKFENDGEITYGLKEPHSEELSKLLTAKSTK